MKEVHITANAKNKKRLMRYKEKYGSPYTWIGNKALDMFFEEAEKNGKL